MNKEDDLRGLAAQYLDLWERQFSAIAADPAAAGLTAAWFDSLRRASGIGPDERPGASDARTGPQAGTETAAAASLGGDARLDELLDRIARLEERLDRLERASKPPRRRTRTKNPDG